MGRQLPVICGEHVTTDAGTGLVHTAAAHGNDDWLVMRANFPNEKPRVLIGADGKFIVEEWAEESRIAHEQDVFFLLREFYIMCHAQALCVSLYVIRHILLSILYFIAAWRKVAKCFRPF